MYLFDSAIGAEVEGIQWEIWKQSQPITLSLSPISLLFFYGLRNEETFQ
jgi:hypothetical protein